MAKTYEMAIAIKGMLDGSFGSSFKAAPEPNEGLKFRSSQPVQTNEGCAEGHGAAAKTTAAPIYEEARKQVAAYQKQLKDLGESTEIIAQCDGCQAGCIRQVWTSKRTAERGATTVGVAAAPLAAAYCRGRAI